MLRVNAQGDISFIHNLYNSDLDGKVYSIQDM